MMSAGRYALCCLIAVGAVATFCAVGRSRPAARPPVTPPGMVYVPGGPFRMGTDDTDADEDARPRRRVSVGSFFISRCEVTNAEFRRFKPSRHFPKGQEQYPVTGVTWDEAAAYARRVGGSLPTEAEWEKAACGTDGRRYPWGDTFEAARANIRSTRAGAGPGGNVASATRASRGNVANATPAPAAGNVASATPASGGKVSSVTKAPSCSVAGRRGLRPVGSFPAGASPYGALDMAGNAWEWVEGFYEGDPDRRIIRGGAHGYGERSARAYARGIEGAGVT